MKTDVAVVGAGPAGTWAGYRLARAGASVTIFDSSHPREKPCGGGVTGRALALIGGALEPATLPASVIRSARFTDTARCQSAVIPLDRGATLSQPGALVVASRAAFDSALLAAAVRAGVRVQPSRVLDLTIGPDGARLETTGGACEAAFVIGADGATSLVRRRVARAFRRDELSIATGFFARGVTSDEIVIELVADPPGYIWSFPRPDHLAIGVCGDVDAGFTAERLRARTAEWIHTTNIAEGAPLERYSWPIPSLGARGFATLDVAGPRWCLVGDAAGLVDPITREGIYFALASAGWAAEALTDAGATGHYVSRLFDEAIPELTRAARLKAGFFRPAFTALMMQALQQSAGIRRVVADLIAGRQSYRMLKWRLLETLELGLAARALLQARA
jgi:geranylgeranyl reductase family protein